MIVTPQHWALLKLVINTLSSLHFYENLSSSETGLVNFQFVGPGQKSICQIFSDWLFLLVTAGFVLVKDCREKYEIEIYLFINSNLRKTLSHEDKLHLDTLTFTFYFLNLYKQTKYFNLFITFRKIVLNYYDRLWLSQRNDILLIFTISAELQNH